MILFACPKCSRQYDVTHLAPRSRVRCICDETFEVAWRSPLAIAHLKCGNCGGEVRAREPRAETADEICAFCGALLPRDERRTLCPGCFAKIEEDARHCHACGIEIRPQALPPIPGDRRCPRCSGELRIRVLEKDELIECAGCTGTWVPAATFARLESDARKRAASAPSADVSSPVPRLVEQRVRYIPCLVCGELMLRKQFVRAGRASGIVVDICKDHGLWLDPSELERALAFVQREARQADRTLPVPEEPLLTPMETRGVPRRLPTPRDGRLLSRTLDLLAELLDGVRS